MKEERALFRDERVTRSGGAMPTVELSAGPIDYEDTGGDGPVLVFLHGLTMDGSVWRHVVAGLQGDYRCVLPTLPLGGHRRPMRAGADLSLAGIALLVGEFIEALGLADVTLIQNDWGGESGRAHVGTPVTCQGRMPAR